MRFVRVFTRADTGQILLVMEQEMPFVRDGFFVEGASFPVVQHDLGLAEHFEPVDLNGAPCVPSRHLLLRLEHVPVDPLAAIDITASHLTQFRAKPGFESEVPEIIDVPTTLPRINIRLRALGRGGVHARCLAWLWALGMQAVVEDQAPGIFSDLPLTLKVEMEQLRAERLTGVKGSSLSQPLQREIGERRSSMAKRMRGEPANGSAASAPES